MFYTAEELAYLQTLQRRGPRTGPGFAIDEETGIVSFNPPLQAGEKFDFAALRAGPHKREALVHVETAQAVFVWDWQDDPHGFDEGTAFFEYVWIVPADA